ncbi:jg1346 [Pararge aegeria aegeria]|uniref:Jg1346 protein n=1 Tax=Pararge aegeria aegeria TaxID=348720 RepID=A0A8S4S415_9NEOP|nr:jg1346 [Pararge aegeria aegeria]
MKKDRRCTRTNSSLKIFLPEALVTIPTKTWPQMLLPECSDMSNAMATLSDDEDDGLQDPIRLFHYEQNRVLKHSEINSSDTAGPISMKLSENHRIDLANNPVKFGDDRSTPIFELSNCQIQLLFTMMIFYCWVYMGVDNDLHPLEKRKEENEYGEK